jgi:hypothetical protein
MARGEALLVLQHLAVELVDEPVDGRVHVRVARLHVDVLAGQVHVRLDLWSSFSTVTITFTSITWSKCRLIRVSFCVT